MPEVASVDGRLLLTVFRSACLKEHLAEVSVATRSRLVEAASQIRNAAPSCEETARWLELLAKEEA